MDLAVTRSGLVMPVRVDPRGLAGPTPDQARGPYWLTTSPGRFVPAGTPRSADQRILEAAAGLPAGSAVTGWAALHWQRTRWFDGQDASGTPLPVPVAIDDHRSLAPRDGVLISSDWLFDGDVIWVDGLPITRPERSVTFAARRARSLQEAVQIIDMATAADRTSIAELREYADRLRGREGAPRLRTSLDLADENAWSPPEVTMRLRWVDRGHPRPRCNLPIFDHGGSHLLTPDLFDPAAGVAGEYNGAVHDGGPPRRRDLNREELYRRLGIEVVSMISTDLRDIFSFEQRLDAAYARARPSELPRPWTCTQPSWWVDTSTVALRRVLDDVDRQIWLRRQVA